MAKTGLAFVSSEKLWRDRARIIISLALIVTLSACGTDLLNLDVKKPSNPPMYNMTGSSAVLACVGGYINRAATPPVDVFVSDIPDHTTSSIETSFLTKNAVMMVTTAIDRLGTEKVEIVGRNGGIQGRRQVQVLGAWTELNRTTSSNAINGKGTFPGGLSLNLSRDKSVNHIALDMAMSENNRIIPQTASSMSVQLNAASGNATLTYDEGGDFAAVTALGFTATEGFHSAERLLIETSVALMMARYYGIDMKNCLDRAGTPPGVRSLDKPVYTHKTPQKRVNQYSRYSPSSSDRPSLVILKDEPVNLQSDVSALPTENGVVVVPKRAGKRARYLEEQPSEYTNRDEGDFSGSASTRRDRSFIQR